MRSAPLDPIVLPDRYRADGRIAAGGMAVVWAAHDDVLDRPVAVKVLASHLSADDTARRRFMREARAAAALSAHPAVVTIFDVGEADGRPFIVMELRSGGTLAGVIGAARPVEAATVLSWLRQAGDALDYAHARGVVHRDVKPANLLLDDEGNLAIADFGIARLAWETTQVTATGQVLGTAGYLSPEQALGEAATPASDRYALATIAYELLAGGRLFPYARHFTAQARAHIEDAPMPPSARNPALPAGVDAVLLRALAKDPGDRWPSAKSLVGALREALAGDLVHEPVRMRQATRRRRRPRVAPALAALAACGAVGALAAGAGGPGLRHAIEDKAPAARAATPAMPRGTPGELNARGYVLFQQGRYEEAAPLFRAAVRRCGGSRQLDPCGYALYNLGASLNRAGRSRAAVPILVRRLRLFGDNAAGDVQRELDAAVAARA